MYVEGKFFGVMLCVELIWCFKSEYVVYSFCIEIFVWNYDMDFFCIYLCICVCLIKKIFLFVLCLILSN